MITLDAFLVFLAAVSLPATYIFLISRWIEPEDREVSAPPKPEPSLPTGQLIHKVA